MRKYILVTQLPNTRWIFNYHIKILVVALLSYFFLQTNLFAQTKSISGTITDTEGFTLPGVNIIIKGSTVGTISNADGEYSIEAKSTDFLVVTYVGFITTEVEVGDNITLDITLEENISDLEEVVVIGYGTQKKKLITGATSQVKGDKLEKRNSTNALQALQGMSAGVNITSTSGQPGEPLKVNIRGLGTINQAAPLYIVDGVQTGDIDYLNPSDIATIDVLKDAASAAIYGNRGANGVILITTKSGKTINASSGKSQISEVTFDAFYGWQSNTKEIRTLNSTEYASIMNEQHLNSNGSPNNLPFNLSDLPAYTNAGVANTNWIDEMFVDDAVTQNYVVGASGGSEYSSFSMSMGYTGQQGIVGGPDLSNFERYNARFNSDHKMFDGAVTIGENLTFASTKNRGIAVGNQYSNSLRGAFNTSPLLPMYDNNGNFFNTDGDWTDQNGNLYWNNTEGNPYASMVYGTQSTTNEQKLLGNLFADIKILKNLKFRSSLGLEYWAGETRSFTPIYHLSVYSFSDYSKASQNLQKGLGLTWDNILTYTGDIGQHHIVAMAGYSVQNTTGSWMYAENTDIAFNDLDHAWLDNATNQDNAAMMSIEGGPNEDFRINSVFGRIQYDYKETYLFNATYRIDGVSKFSPSNSWGYFPSFSAGWVLSNEDFMENLNNTIPYLKLRASWGLNGNCNVTPFNYIAPISFVNAGYNFGDEEGISETGSYPSRLSNPDLVWEKSDQLDIGFDAGLFNNSLVVNFDYYKKTTKDWQIIAPVLATFGTDPPYINGGNVINSGVELSLGYQKNKGDFNYQFNVVGSYNSNEINDIPTEDGIIHGATNSLYANSGEFYRAEAGHAIGYFWGFETDGIFQTSSEVNAYTGPTGNLIQPNAQPGDLRYVDQNNDGVINDDDKIDLGNPIPDFTYGFNFTASYKGFDLLLVTNGVAGNQLVQSYRDHSNKNANYTTEILDRWNGPGTSNTIPRVTNNNINYRFSDIFVKDGSYFRISNITLGYDFANIIPQKIFKSLRVYASVQNLYTFTNYSGMDPEVGYGFDNGDQDRFSSGIDLGFYPRPRTILFGVSVKY